MAAGIIIMIKDRASMTRSTSTPADLTLFLSGATCATPRAEGTAQQGREKDGPSRDDGDWRGDMVTLLIHIFEGVSVAGSEGISSNFHLTRGTLRS